MILLYLGPIENLKGPPSSSMKKSGSLSQAHPERFAWYHLWLMTVIDNRETYNGFHKVDRVGISNVVLEVNHYFLRLEGELARGQVMIIGRDSTIFDWEEVKRFLTSRAF